MALATRSFDTTDLVKPFNIQMEKNATFTQNVNKELRKDFKGGIGDTVSRTIPGYGTVGTDLAIPDANLGYAGGKISLTVGIANLGIAINMIERALEYSSFEEQVAIPYGMNLSSHIEKRLGKKIANSAPGVTVVGSGTLTYSHIANSLASLRSRRPFGEVHMVLGSRLAGQLQSSMTPLYNPNAMISKVITNGDLGMLYGADLHQSQDLEEIVAGTHALGSGTALRVKTIVNTEGATSVVFEVNGGTATLTGTVADGEPIALTGYYVVDALGNTTSQPFNLIAQATATASGNEVTVTTQPLYFTGPRKNISGSNIAATTGATLGLTASKTYARAVAWAKPAVDFVSVPMQEIYGAEKQSSAGFAFDVTAQWGGLIQDGVNMSRWDVLSGEAVMRDMWLEQIYVLMN